jgi:hypothetical protein
LAVEAIGRFASLLDERSRHLSAHRPRGANACEVDVEGTLTATEYAEAVATFVQQQGGEIQYQLLSDHIAFSCTTCPFGERIKQAPSFCHLIGAGLWWGATRHFGYGKVIFKKRIAVGDDHCDIRVYLKKTAKAESEAGIAHLSAPGPFPKSVGADVPINETVRRLQARIRFLERRVEELEGALEERKVIERAKGILMERLKLTEVEAMRRLQKESQSRNRKLAEIAHIIVQAGEII